MEFDVFVGGSGKKLTDIQKQALPDFGVSLADGAIENKSYAVVKKWLEGVITLAKQNLANCVLPPPHPLRFHPFCFQDVVDE